ncbi:MAG TPA: fibronectin type III domain-containing protein [Vicinamibacterales bacterium]|nr:fibronectin type III domain-containing protein [Vicinamibacterales bacterium]
MLAIAGSVACGKKGPPLAPFVRVPAAVTSVIPLRVGNDVYLSFKVPETNADGQKPADIAAVEVYAVTSEQAPATEKQRDVATLIATLPVHPILPEVPVPANGSPPPPIPLPPGVDRGAAVAVKEALTPEARAAVELPVDRPIAKPLEPVAVEERYGPLVAPAVTPLPRRHYFVISKSRRERESVPSTPVSIPLEPGSSAPGAPTVTNSATDVTITWTPSPDARASTFLLPPTAKPTGGANATPSNTTPKVLPPLTAKSLGFNSQATTYHVYDVTPKATPAEPDPFAIAVPLAITPAPLVDTELVIKGVTFGVERCFEVRPVDQVFGTPVIGPASPRTCFTPQDTYPPSAPKSLAAIAGAGVINLIWDANSESDLAGYLVLRGEAPGDTLQPITKEPVAVTSYRDESVRAGTRYVYAVVAVDRATPPNTSPQSNRAEETARQ